MQTSLWVYMALLHISIGLHRPLCASMWPPPWVYTAPFHESMWSLYGSVWPLQWVCVAPSVGLCSHFHRFLQPLPLVSTGLYGPFNSPFCVSLQVYATPSMHHCGPSAGLHGFMWTSPQVSVVPSEGLCRSMQTLSEADPGFALGGGKDPPVVGAPTYNFVKLAFSSTVYKAPFAGLCGFMWPLYRSV